HGGVQEQVGQGGRAGGVGPGGAGDPGAAEEVRVSGGRHSGGAGIGEGGDGRGGQGREGERADPEADGRGGQLHSDAGPAGGQAVPAADRGRVLDFGARDGGHGARGAWAGEDQRQGGDRGPAGDAGHGDHGRGDVPQADGRVHGGRQRRAAAARGGEEDLERGMCLVAPKSVTPHKKFKASTYVLSKEEG